jgi:hypothetical protein
MIQVSANFSFPPAVVANFVDSLGDTSSYQDHHPKLTVSPATCTRDILHADSILYTPFLQDRRLPRQQNGHAVHIPLVQDPITPHRCAD